MANVLIIDDDKLICETIANLVRRMGHQATCSYTLQDGLEKSSSQLVDVVFLDVRLPDGNGLEVLPRIQASPSLPEIIIMTGYGDPDGAELAIKHGAWDYIQKPSTMDTMTLPFVRALQYREEKKASKAMMILKREGIIGNSPKIKACLDLLAQVASSNANVLITGETGTGKELFAVAIHKNSPRANKNFVVVDCAALPENLVESILFGHEKGAYTGADRAKDGLILQADGGTLFLDEVGELPVPIQKSFLRTLQERKFRPVGGKEEIESDFRLIAASNRNLDDMVRQGNFREDLLFRLRSFSIELPPLRERPEDIKDLVIYYTEVLCKRYEIEPKEFSPDFFDVLVSYPWPGNVRELINALERALVNGRYERILFQKHLPTHIRAQIARSSVSEKETAEIKKTPSSKIFPKIQELREKAIGKAEEQYLRDLISFTQGNIKEACGISGISRSRLYLLLKKYNIST
ncbi:MAG: sigma-54-dependent Fis family transcriptional regulator [Syntrophaceae bacterium]|nr:sigma-54-dependent Fis family transcriptional regulator [Syntrophaceae bacterium]